MDDEDLEFSFWRMFMLHGLWEDPRLREDDLSCDFVRIQLWEIIEIVEGEDIRRAIDSSMVTIEDSDLIITEESYIENAILSDRDGSKHSKYLNDTVVIDGECRWLIQEFEGKHIFRKSA